MNDAAPYLRVPVGVVVERRKAASTWTDFIWRPVAVLAGLPEAAPWTSLTSAEDVATFYAGVAEIALYRSEADNYRRNLASGVPALWVSLQATGGEPPYVVVTVTADPAEGEGLTESGQFIVEAVAMPDTIGEIVASFVAEQPIGAPFEKRRRDRADPEALARRSPRSGASHER